MQANIYQIYCATTSLFILSGCLATTNLLTDGKLSPNHLKVAQEMAERTMTNCITVKYRGSDDNPLNKMKLSKLPEIKSLWESDSGWYKADSLVDQTWDFVYYNYTTGRLVCGQKNWDKYAESSKIQFIRVDEKQLSLNASINTSQSTTVATTPETLEVKLRKLKHLHEEKLISTTQYDMQVKKVLEEGK